MSHTMKRAAFPEAFKPKKLSEIKDKDDRRFRIEDAARTLERLADVERDVEDIKTDPELFEAAKAKIDQKIADLSAAKKS